MKECVDCKSIKSNNEYYIYELKKKSGRCKDCLKHRANLYRIKNIELKKLSDKNYRVKNKLKLKKQKSIYIIKNKSTILNRQKLWYQNNRDRLLNKAKQYRDTHKMERSVYENNRRKNDISYKLRTSISKIIGHKLKIQLSSKKSKSCATYLSYSIQDLKENLEKKFEPWMSWDNWGRYNSETWDDNDSSTWTWQIDHIKPQSLLPYTSMEDENFKKCWSLDNLRPLSSKINIINGTMLSKNRKKFK
jgi:hypothetical protein